jgi:hypothetical protein
MNRPKQPLRAVGGDLGTRIKTAEDNVDQLFKIINNPKVPAPAKSSQGASTSVIIKTISLGGAGAGGGIPVLASAPYPVAFYGQLWIQGDSSGNVTDYDHIFLVFPDGTDHNRCITLNDLVFTP